MPELELPLFTYGTLMLPALMERILGRPLHPTPVRALACSRHPVIGAPYPGLLLCAECREGVRGELYTDMRPLDWPRLDAYESSLYDRKIIDIQWTPSKRSKAYAYVIPEKHADRLDRSQDWSFQAFLQQHASQTLREA